MTLTVAEADRLARLELPYPPPSDEPTERCQGPTFWHRPFVADWNAGARTSTCTWCGRPIARRFCDPTWRTAPAQPHLTRSPAMPNPDQPAPSTVTPEHRARAIAAAVHLVGATAMTNLGYVPDSQLQEAARVADSIADYIAHGQLSGLGMRR